MAIALVDRERAGYLTLTNSCGVYSVGEVKWHNALEGGRGKSDAVCVSPKRATVISTKPMPVQARFA